MRPSVALGLIAVVNTLAAFLTQWLVFVRLGAGAPTDALLAGSIVPNLVLAVIVGALVHVLVPLFTDEPDARLRAAAWDFVLIGAAVLGALMLALLAGAPLWVRATAPGLARDHFALALQLTRVQLLVLPFCAAWGVLWSATQARRRFLWAEGSALLANAAGLALLFVWLERGGGAHAGAWASNARVVFQVVLLLPVLGRFVRVPAALRRETRGEAWRRIRPLLLGTTYYNLDTVVDRCIAGMAPPGGLSLLFLGQQIFSAALNIVSKVCINPLVPDLAAQTKAGNDPGFVHAATRGVRAVALVSIAGFVVLIAAGEPLLRLLIGYGRITPENVHLLWRTMALGAGMWLAAPLGRLFAALFLARGETRTPSLLNALAFSVGAPLKIALFWAAGLNGLAVAISLGQLLALVLLGGAAARTIWRRASAGRRCPATRCFSSC